MAERIGAVHIPDFSAALFIRDHPDYRNKPDTPVGIAETGEDDSELVCCNASARACGIVPGMTVAQARILEERLVIGVQDREREMYVSSRLINRLQSLTPFVEEAVCGEYFLEVSGLMLLYKSELEFATKVIEFVRRGGFPVTVGIAGSKSTAAVAALYALSQEEKPCVIVPEQGEREFLSPLAIAYLPVSDETKEKLRILGIRTIGHIGSFPANELRHRFGADGRVMVRLARGEELDTFAPRQAGEDLVAEQFLLFPISHAPALIRQVKPLLGDLLARLRRVCEGCSCVVIELKGEDTQTLRLELAVDSPTLTLTVFMRQLSQVLEKTKLSAGVREIRVRVPEAVRLMAEQLDLPQSTPGQTMELPLHKPNIPPGDLAGVFVSRRHTAPLPEQNFSLVPFASATAKSIRPDQSAPVRSQAYASYHPGGLRLFQPPQAVRLTATAGRFRHIEINSRTCAIHTVRGPWYVSGQWWRAPFERRYYEVELADPGHTVYLIYCDYSASGRQVFLQGVFD